MNTKINRLSDYLGKNQDRVNERLNLRLITEMRLLRKAIETLCKKMEKK